MQLIVEGWLLGVSSGPFCLGVCAPFIVPYLFAQGASKFKTNALTIAEFLLGRLIAYLMIGAFAGWLGRQLSADITRLLTRGALFITASLLLFYAFRRFKTSSQSCIWKPGRFSFLRFPILLGFFIGINVCPPFIAAIARVVDIGGIASGMIFFFSFFIGTSLYVLPLFTLSPFTKAEKAQHIGVLSSFIVGVWFIIAALAGH
jgi:sulfite exporter TauE/SafE